MFLRNYQNIVVKIGSNTLTYLMEANFFCSFVKDINIINNFAKVTIVTSGAIATARKELNLPKPESIPQKQALSSIGQVYLMHAYHQEFLKVGIKVGQILVTSEDIKNTKSLQNLHSTINTLREMNAIPVINENDAISTEEIKIGDNDTLASHIACAIKADLLIILTDVNGVYDSNPNTNPNAKIITHTGAIPLEKFENEPLTEFGSGGILTKIKAGNIAVINGFHCIITNGRIPNPLVSIAEGKCTVFIPKHIEYL